MGIYRSENSELRKSIGDNIGQRIIIKESPGKRSKPLEKSAIIENTYKDYFRVKFEEANRVGSYNYTDVFTRSVEISMYNGESYEPLVQPQLEVKRTRSEKDGWINETITETDTGKIKCFVISKTFSKMFIVSKSKDTSPDIGSHPNWTPNKIININANQNDGTE